MKTSSKLRVSLISSSLLIACLSGNALAADGTIIFNGELTTNGCTVDPSSVSQTVELGTVATSALTGQPGKEEASPTGFSIKLKDCPDPKEEGNFKKARIKFESSKSSGVEDVLGLDAGSVATGVGITLYNGDTRVKLNSSESTQYELSEENTTIDFIAKFYSLNSTPTPGSLTSTVQFTMNYE